jgi:hypothetical protein
MKKLNEIPRKNEMASINERNNILDIIRPENGIESSNPQVNGIMVTKT